MATINIQRQLLIRNVVLRNPDTVVDTTVGLWEKLATELISIIGEGGFQSMYSRSLHLISTQFPWMEQSHPLQQLAGDFPGLRSSFEGHETDEIGEASIALLATFIDILTTLIGESLTTSILRTAWGDDTLDKAGKENTE